MLKHVIAFELRYQVRQPLLWAAAAIFAVLSFIATITDALAIGVVSLCWSAWFAAMRCGAWSR